MEDIDVGLVALARGIGGRNIRSIALPPLGVAWEGYLGLKYVHASSQYCGSLMT